MISQADGAHNPRARWQDHEESIAEARGIIADPNLTGRANSSACKLCHWYTACIERLVAHDDLTLIPELRRDAMLRHLQSVAELAGSNPDVYINGNKGPSSTVSATTP